MFIMFIMFICIDIVWKRRCQYIGYGWCWWYYRLW